MGFKRPFCDEEFQELPFKQARLVDYSNKLTQFADGIPYNIASQKPDILGDNEGRFVKFQWHETFENDNDNVKEAPNVRKDFGNGAPLSVVTSSSGDEDVEYGAVAYACLSPEYFEFDAPRRTFFPSEDVQSSYLDRFPRKQVPLGPNHQAAIPLCGSDINNNNNLESKEEPVKLRDSFSLSGTDHNIYNENEDKLMGTCFISMPDTESSAHGSDEAGVGRTNCSCPDEGSVRCVRQHIMEARERLKESLGHEKFAGLGFHDMGEAVTQKWSEEEERVFQAVVYSNPASLGHNFWNHLSQVFPTRTTEEIVSYYFNVFILRRRAAQNRSELLDIDSDDDELHGMNGGSYELHVSEEDEDSAIESLADQYEQVGHGDGTLADDDSGDDDDDDDDDDDGDDDCDGSGDMGDHSGDATEAESGIDYFSEALDVKSFDVNQYDRAVKHMGKNDGSVGEEFTVQDDSCMSFEFQADKGDNCGPVDSGAALQVSGVTGHSECLPGKVGICGDVVGQIYLLEPCDTKVWDGRYMSPIKGVDLLPTCNIIDEIFGQGASDDKK